MLIQKSVVLLAVLGVAFVASTAQAGSKSGSYSRSYGNSKAGGTVYASGYMRNSRSYSKSYGKVKGTVRMLRRSAEAGSVTAKAYQRSGSGYGRLDVRVGGRTVYSRTLTRSWSKHYYTLLNVFNPPPSMTVAFGPIPVTVSGNVGAGVRLDIDFTLSPATLSAGLHGTGQAWGYGSGSASVGVPGYNAGVRLTANFANHQLRYGMNANRSGLSGSLTYTLDPIRLLVDVFLRLWPLPELTHNLANYSYRRYSRTLIR